MNSHFVISCRAGVSAFRIRWWIVVVCSAAALGWLKEYVRCVKHDTLVYCLEIIAAWIEFGYRNIHNVELCLFFENKKLLHVRDMMEDVYSLYNLPAVDWDQWHFPEKINYPKFAAHSYSISSQQMLISMLLLIGIHFRFCLKWR